MNTIKEKYETWWDHVRPAGASEVQFCEMRRAFYSGAAAMLGIMDSISTDDVSEAAGIEILEGLHEETRDFFKRVGTDEEGA